MKFLLFAMIFVVCQSASAQSAEKLVPLERMSAYSWAGKNGIISNNITGTLQSKDGYLWITTYNGILKFDGHSAKLYDKAKLPFLTVDGFRNVYQSDGNGDLYFASQADGILKYSNDKFELLKVKNGAIPISIGCLLIESDSLLWVGTNNDGLYKIENNLIEKIQIKILEKASILTLYKDSLGTLWAGTEGDGLIGIRKDNSILQYNINNGLQSNVVNTLIEKNGILFIGSQSGIRSLKDGVIKSMNFMNNQSINCILPKNNEMWIGSDNGLGRYNLITKKEEFITEHNSSSITRVNWLTFDNEGSLWLSTGRDGLIQMRQAGVINYTRFDGLSSDKINIIVEDFNKEGYFIGCDDGNAFYLTDGKIEPFNIENNFSPTGVRDILQEENGNLWIAGYRGLILKKGNKEKLYSLEDGLPSLDLRLIFKDSRGAIWIGSRSGGLIKIINEKIVAVINKENGLQSNFILSIDEDANGNIFLGTHSGGLSIITSSGEIELYNITSDVVGEIVFNTHISQNGDAWIISNLGIYSFKNKKFHNLSFREKYSGISYYDWLEDQQGNAWITTTQGVINISKVELIRFEKNPTIEVESRLINTSDGMIENECTGAVRSLLASNGQLWIPTINGVSVIDPEGIKQNDIIPKVYITDLEVDDQSYSKNNITIPAGKTRYVFDFTCLSYVAPKEVKFKYKLNNFDPEYILTDNLRRVEYTNLPPGKYSFHVMAANNDNTWNIDGDRFDFTVASFYYQTYWFFSLLILGVLSILFGLYKWRIYNIKKMNEKLRKVNSELDSFVYSASHDLRAPLASLLGLIDLSKKDHRNINVYLDKMHASVKKLDTFIGDIIDFSSNDRKGVQHVEIDFESILESILNELQFLNPDNLFEISIDVDKQEVFISDERRLGIILRNLISNAFKYKDEHKKEHKLFIKIYSSSKGAIMMIKDNGIGIDKNSLNDIFKMFYRATENNVGSGLGLYIVKETTEKLLGKVTVESSINVGSTFTVTVPSLNG
jgi:ligand-binding sensor domain-containing protein/signal transduction histidine kinase